MVVKYCGGMEIPDEENPFPELTLSPDQEGSTGHFLECKNILNLNLHGVSGKTLYKTCVKFFLTRNCSRWSWHTLAFCLQVEQGWWSILYKPPLTKTAGDIQWRIWHEIMAINAVIILHPETGHECPFCLQRETIFHNFMQWSRLKPLFIFLQTVFFLFYWKFLSANFFPACEIYSNKAGWMTTFKLHPGPSKNGHSY